MIRKLIAAIALAVAVAFGGTGCAPADVQPTTPAVAFELPASYHPGDDLAIEDTTDPAVEVTADPSRAEVVASLLAYPNTLDNDGDGVITAGEQGWDCAVGAPGFLLVQDAAGVWGCGEF